MKQELQTFAQSAKDLLQSEEDSAKRKVSSPSQSLKDASAELPKPQCERAKIVISIQDKDGPKQFRVFLVCLHLECLDNKCIFKNCWPTQHVEFFFFFLVVFNNNIVLIYISSSPFLLSIV